ncbi:MAG TPA: phosphoribosylglycinamide formyltransferase 2 [Gammaproteobacteria bacterium]|nr:phosphoribosylglycinamide formyltransferase 2 [Gammaproteobacteria bacterium]
MHIGTPLSPSATRIMLLGAGELGKEVIISLQRLGVEVIAVDRYAHSPGQQVAHHAHVIDMSDPVALRALIMETQPEFIVPEIEAIATDVLAEVEQELNIQIIPTAKATELTMNREGIRRLAAEELNIPTSSYEFAESLSDLRLIIENSIGYPCVVKPVMSSSGKGQSVVYDPSDVATAWEYAMSGGRVSRSKVIVEGFVQFDYEITLLTVRALNESGEVATYFCDPIGHVQRHGDYVESWQPQPMQDVALQQAKEYARRITQELGGRGLFGVEFFVQNSEVYFSEVSPRPHDTGMVTMVTQRQNEFELHARAILGLPVNTESQCCGASAVTDGGVDGKGVRFHGLPQALSVPNSEIRLFGKPESFSRRRMGVALAYADTVEQAREWASLAASQVKVEKGKS